MKISPFTIKIILVHKDGNGADGMALVFKRTNMLYNKFEALGNSGGGVGYEGISNSLIVEFDTYGNIGGSTGVEDYGDPFL